MVMLGVVTLKKMEYDLPTITWFILFITTQRLGLKPQEDEYILMGMLMDK